MKKLFLVALMVTLGVLCFATVSMAENKGFDVYLDYSQTSAEDLDVDFLTVGMDYQINGFIVGGLYSTSTRIDPDLEDISISPLMVYAGYDFVKDDNFVLGLVGSFLDFSIDSSDYDYEDDSYYYDHELDITSLGIGLRAEGNWDRFKASLLYLYGIDNNVDVPGNDEDDFDDFDFNFTQLKCSYFFNDLVGISAVYRNYELESDSLDGFGIGVDFKF
ncbi:MAG TPA: hypothetical protein VHR47_02125 [Bacillota bacterium]|nr:hypothetical protein [Bacillota bacterium]